MIADPTRPGRRKVYESGKRAIALVPLAIAAVLTTLTPVLPASAATDGDAKAGAKVFAKCLACHKIDASGTSGLGPNLKGIIGRRAGMVPGFRYSPAMATYGKVWSAATLDAYLTAPAKAVPGNRMAFVGLRDPAERRNVIAYLRSASK